MKDCGYISLHRKMLNWEWYDDINSKVLFIHCLLKANYINKYWRGIEIKRGEFITSLNNLSNETGLSLQQTRTALNKLISTNELSKTSTSQLTKISICKYDDYQNIKLSSNKRATNEQQTSNKRATTTNKDNKDNKDNNIIPSFDDFKNHALEKCKTADLIYNESKLRLKYDSWIENNWKDGYNNKIKNWKSKLTNNLSYIFDINKNQSSKITKLAGT